MSQARVAGPAEAGERSRIVLFPSLGTVHVTMMRRRGKQEVASGRYITIPISHVVLYFAVTNAPAMLSACRSIEPAAFYGQIVRLPLDCSDAVGRSFIATRAGPEGYRLKAAAQLTALQPACRQPIDAGL